MAELMLFEDNQATRELLSLYLARNGHDVLACTGAENLQTLMTQKPPDLILLDLDLGTISGVELCRELRSMPPPHNTTPILILSCANRRDVDSLALDVDGYILKMTSLSEILLQINQYLDQSGLAPMNGNGHHAPPVMEISEWDDPSFATEYQDPHAFNILDTNVLEALIQDLAIEAFSEIMDVFVQDMKKRAAEINFALINKNNRHIYHQAHALKSSAAAYGATQLSVICTNINVAFKAHDHHRVQQQASLLAQATMHTIKAVHHYLDNAITHRA